MPGRRLHSLLAWLRPVSDGPQPGPMADGGKALVPIKRLRSARGPSGGLSLGPWEAGVMATCQNNSA